MGRVVRLCVVVVLAGCNRGATGETAGSETSAVVAAPGAAASSEDGDSVASGVNREGLLIGELRLAANPVIDGDTIRVEGIDTTVRLLSLDTEERIHGKQERAAVARDFGRHLVRSRGDAKRPKKPGTPMGEEAAEFAERFFAGVEVVRLERDDPKEIRGHFGRLLAYALVEKDGRWTSYNVECVRAGMSPYFTKYGYSHRFHNQLSHAEAEARQAKRGIWNPDAQGYGDYDERKAWWNARADFIRAFEHEANRRSDLVLLSHWDALETLEKRIGEEVTVLSTIDEIERFERLVRVSLAVDRDSRFPVIFFDLGAFDRSGIREYVGEPVAVRGRIERYEKGSYRTLQIVVKDPQQVTLPELP